MPRLLILIAFMVLCSCRRTPCSKDPIYISFYGTVLADTIIVTNYSKNSGFGEPISVLVSDSTKRSRGEEIRITRDHDWRIVAPRLGKTFDIANITPFNEKNPESGRFTLGEIEGCEDGFEYDVNGVRLRKESRYDVYGHSISLNE